MDRRAVYLRTSKGLKELMGRTSLLGSTDRNILFLVTGKVSLGEIEARLDPSLKTRLQASIDRLVREEFIFIPGPSEMGSETDITNGVLIDPMRSATAVRAVAPVATRSEPVLEDALATASDDQINAALKQAQNDSRRQSIVGRLQQVESLAVAAGTAPATATAVRKPAVRPPAPDAAPSQSHPSSAGASSSLSPTVVLARTAKGAQEFIGRSQTLPPTLAKLLVLVDGEATVASIIARTGDPDGRVVGLGIQKLLRDGYVQEAAVIMKDLIPGADFETTLQHSAALARQGAIIDAAATAHAQIEDGATPAPGGSAYDEVAKVLAEHAAMEARVEETAKQVIARAAAAEAPAISVPAPAVADSQIEPARTRADGKKSSRRRGQQAERPAQVEDTAAIVHSVDPDRVASAPAEKRRLAIPRWSMAVLLMATGVAGAAYWLWPLFDASHYAQMASRYLGRPVSIAGVGVAFTPAPAIRLADVRVGGGSGFRADSVSVVLVPATLMDPGRALHDVRISGALVTTDELRALIGTPAKDGAALSLRSVQAEGVKIVDRYWTLSGLNLHATIGPKGDLSQLVVSAGQGDTRAVFTPASAGTRIAVTSSKLRPFGADFDLLDFSARGTYSSEEIVFTEFDGRVLQGVVKGQARIRAGAVWSAEGTLEGRGMELAELSKPLLRDGQFSAKARFTTNAPNPEKLFSTGMLEGSIAADHGTLLGVDISRVAQGEANPRGTTSFSELVATFRADAGSRQIASNVRFKSNRVGAAATVHVDAKQALTGQLTAELATPSGPLRGSVNLSGTAARLMLSK